MADPVDTEGMTLSQLREHLAQLALTGSPAIAKFAGWAVEHPQEIAFQSVRSIAAMAGVNVNSAYRTALALGFPGYDAWRETVRSALRHSDSVYGNRAARLGAASANSRMEHIRETAHQNIDALHSREMQKRIALAVEMLLGARTIYCVGVRSCLALAHGLAYSGRMAFESFAPPVIEAGSIIETVAQAGENDVVVLITFSLYSREVVTAHRIAKENGARIISITDSYTAPITDNASCVFVVPMKGPQALPSATAAWSLLEILVAEMIARSTDAEKRIREYEGRMKRHGAYVDAAGWSGD